MQSWAATLCWFAIYNGGYEILTLPCRAPLPYRRQTGATFCGTIVGWEITCSWLWAAVVSFGLCCFANKAEFISFVSGFECVPASPFYFLEEGVGRESGFSSCFMILGQSFPLDAGFSTCDKRGCKRAGHPKGFRVWLSDAVNQRMSGPGCPFLPFPCDHTFKQ